MVRCGLDLKVDPLARITLELATLLALDSGSGLLAELTPDLIGINLGTGTGSSHHPSNEVVGGEILNPFQWNLTRRLAPETHDGPAARGYVQPMNKIFSSPPPPLTQYRRMGQHYSWSQLGHDDP